MFADDQGLRFSELRLRAYKDDQVSEPFAVASDVSVDENGQFVAAFENAVMPGDFSPTGSDVVFDLEFIGVVTGNASICGFVQGEVETLDLAPQQSTFEVFRGLNVGPIHHMAAAPLVRKQHVNGSNRTPVQTS